MDYKREIKDEIKKHRGRLIWKKFTQAMTRGSVTKEFGEAKLISITDLKIGHWIIM
ncbi:MAG: hypothetical protein N3I35_00825 [Clostridia bacterium]|nr:hypothetical protein [Clostridia bacterium]